MLVPDRVGNSGFSCMYTLPALPGSFGGTSWPMGSVHGGWGPRRNEPDDDLFCPYSITLLLLLHDDVDEGAWRSSILVCIMAALASSAAAQHVGVCVCVWLPGSMPVLARLHCAAGCGEDVPSHAIHAYDVDGMDSSGLDQKYLVCTALFSASAVADEQSRQNRVQPLARTSSSQAQWKSRHRQQEMISICCPCYHFGLHEEIVEDDEEMWSIVGC